MRYIESEEIVKAVERLCIEACYELGEDVLAALKKALQKETHAGAAKILNQLIENARIAKEEKIPLCQDTGLAVVFVEQGAEAAIRGAGGGGLVEAINAGVSAGYEKGYLRKSVVADPLNRRRNTGTNSPAIIHHSIVSGDRLKITVMAKG
jgi:fumarate hydratase subunit alpha